MFHNFDQMEAADWSPSLEERVLYRYQASIVIDKASSMAFFVAGGARYSMVTRYRICGDIHIARCHGPKPDLIRPESGRDSIGDG